MWPLRICFLLCLSPLLLIAQQGVVKGVVVESSTQLPLEFVSVSLCSVKDSAVIQNTSTDKNGSFLIKAMPGDYFLRLIMIGFIEYKGPRIAILADQEKNLGLISLNASDQLLGDVVITEEKSIFQNGIDRKIYDVAQDVQSVSGSASNILENIPSVTVDVEGNVSLLGSSNVTIFINGKPSPMMRTNAASALQQIPANMIERIEIITNPSAKYKPDGAAGIINIVLKKNTTEGFHGILTLNGGLEQRYNGSLNFNYKPGKFNYFGSYSYRHDLRGRTSKDERFYYDSTGSFTSHEYTERDLTAHPNSHMSTLGFDFSPDSMNEMGVSAYGEFFITDKEEKTMTEISDASSSWLLNSDRRTNIEEEEWEAELEGYYTRFFKKKDRELNLEFSVADHQETEDNFYTTSYIFPAVSPIPDHFRVTQREKQMNGLLEYTDPVGEDMELVAGYEYSVLKQDFDFFGEYFDNSSSSWLNDTTRTRSFLFSQGNHALYSTFEFAIEDLGILLGARAESTTVISHLENNDSTVSNNYLRFYPTIHFMYEVADEQEVKLSYSRRVNRPEGDELNPFLLYSDPRNAEAGNPYLLPEQTHAVELSYSLSNKKITFVPTLFYRYTYDAFSEVSEYMNDSVLVTRFVNLETQQNNGLELIFNAKFKKLISVMWSGTVYNDVIDASNLGYSNSRSAWYWQSKMNIKITAWKGGTVQLNPLYRSAQLTPQGKNLDMFVVDGGLRQDFLKGKLGAIFSISDIFRTRRWAFEVDSPALKQEVINKRKSQFFYVGISWNFGKIKMKNEDIRFEDKL